LPDPNSTVKINRTVFLTVNRVIPPMVEMPKLEGQSLSFALQTLSRYHLQLGDTIYKPDFRAGAVLEQQYNGVNIPEKTKIQWGSKITLIIGGGLDDQQLLVPSLVGLTYAEAKAELDNDGIIIASVLPYNNAVIRDTASAYVVKQSPDRFDEDKKPRFIKPGQIMDLIISPEMINPKDSTDNKNL